MLRNILFQFAFKFQYFNLTPRGQSSSLKGPGNLDAILKVGTKCRLPLSVFGLLEKFTTYDIFQFVIHKVEWGLKSNGGENFGN